MEAEPRLAEQAAPHVLPELEVHPAAVLELCYAYYRLLRPTHEQTLLPWQRELRDHPPRWLATLPADDGRLPGYEALLLACAFGYEADDSPERFLSDLPGLPTRLLAEFDEVFDPTRFDEEQDDDSKDHYEALRTSFEVLEEQGASCLAGTLTRLWTHLRAAWEDGGVQVTAAASRDLLAAALASKDLALSLPAHHFVNFETSPPAAASSSSCEAASISGTGCDRRTSTRSRRRASCAWPTASRRSPTPRASSCCS